MSTTRHRHSRPGRAAVPRELAPMLASIGPEPSDEEDWAFEAKWDGVRAIAHVDDRENRQIRILSRNGNDVTASYPELEPLGDALGATQAIIDGEIVATNRSGPSFATLQRRIHVHDPALVRRLINDVPVSYFVFDLLYLDGRSLLSEPYRDRRRALEGLDVDGPSWSTPPSWTSASFEQVMDATRANGVEGVVAKRLASPYRPGTRSDAWRKFKHHLSQEFVVGGWSAGRGARNGELGALLIGFSENGRFRYAGKVGTGFDRTARVLLLERMDGHERKDSPFADPVPTTAETTWVDPVIVVEVEFTEWTTAGHVRHPSYQGLRTDKDPGDVHRETTPSES